MKTHPPKRYPSGAMTLQELVDRDWPVEFKCRECVHSSAWNARSLRDRYGARTRLDDLTARLRCGGYYLNQFTCGGAGLARPIVPNDALGPDGRTIGEIYRVEYEDYSPAAVRAKAQQIPNAARNLPREPSRRDGGDNPCGWL